jgi:hypothetical protein
MFHTATFKFHVLPSDGRTMKYKELCDNYEYEGQPPGESTRKYTEFCET